MQKYVLARSRQQVQTNTYNSNDFENRLQSFAKNRNAILFHSISLGSGGVGPGQALRNRTRFFYYHYHVTKKRDESRWKKFAIKNYYDGRQKPFGKRFLRYVLTAINSSLFFNCLHCVPLISRVYIFICDRIESPHNRPLVSPNNHHCMHTTTSGQLSVFVLGN